MKHAAKQCDLEHDEIEFKKNPNVFTFSPEIHEINYSGALKPIKSGQLAKIVGGVTPRGKGEVLSENESPENVRPSFPAVADEKKERRKKGNRKSVEAPAETTQSRAGESINPSDYTGNNYLDDMDNNSMFNASQSVINQKSLLEQPHLSIDIALGDKKHRITLFKDSDCAQVSKDFAKQHNLPSAMQLQL